MSDNFCISAGVPQGAILRPILYILYTSDIPRQEILDNGTKISGYTDDFNLWNSAPIKFSFLARKALQKSIDEMTQWADRWRMKINPPKRNSIIIKNELLQYTINIYISTKKKTPKQTLSNSDI